MKKVYFILLGFFSFFVLVGCGGTTKDETKMAPEIIGAKAVYIVESTNE